MSLKQFHNGTADITEIFEGKYYVVIKSDGGDVLKKLELSDSEGFYDFWFGFEYGGEEFDLNIFDGKYFGTGGKWGATVYPVHDGQVITEFYEQLKVMIHAGGKTWKKKSFASA